MLYSSIVFKFCINGIVVWQTTVFAAVLASGSCMWTMLHLFSTVALVVGYDAVLGAMSLVV